MSYAYDGMATVAVRPCLGQPPNELTTLELN